MVQKRSVKNMTGAVQNYRRRAMAMLTARVAALDSCYRLCLADDKSSINAARETTRDILEKLREMR